MNRKTVFFDFGRTLFGHPDLCSIISRKITNDGDELRETVLDALSKTRLGITPDNFRTIKELTGNVLAGLCRDRGRADISDEADCLCRDTYGYRSYLYPETLIVLDELAEHGVEMIAASDNDDDILEIQVQKHGLARYFSEWFISEQVKCYKPSDEYIANLRRHTRSRETDCYFVGDAAWDVQCGQKLGINSVHIDREGQGNIHGADFVINSLTGLLPLLET